MQIPGMDDIERDIMKVFMHFGPCRPNQTLRFNSLLTMLSKTYKVEEITAGLNSLKNKGYVLQDGGVTLTEAGFKAIE